MDRIADNIDIVHKLVGMHAAKLRTQFFSRDDMFSAGMLGLMKANETYDKHKEKQCTFVTFANKRVYWHILDEYRESFPVSRRLVEDGKVPPTVSLDEPITDNQEGSVTFKDNLKSKSNIEIECYNRQLSPIVARELQRILNIRELFVISMVFYDDVSQKDVAYILDLSEGMVSINLKNAITKLQKSKTLKELRAQMYG